MTFPYFEHQTGLVSVGTLYPGNNQLNLQPRGKVTSHAVKYAHHPDGEAHFSRDGKVQTVVRRKAVPLDRIGGHLFTLHVTGYDRFTSLTASERSAQPNVRKTFLTWPYRPPVPFRIKIVGRLYSASSLKVIGTLPSRPGLVPTRDEMGVERWAYLASPPEGWPGAHRIVLLTAEEWSATNYPSGPHVSFIGGFDPEDIASNSKKQTEVLALSYPIESAEQLAGELGSIDLT